MSVIELGTCCIVHQRTIRGFGANFAKGSNMRYIIFVMLAAVTFVPAQAAEKRCGWFHNPTPANGYLDDRAGLWTITLQGGYRAKGADDMPDMTTNGWNVTNGSSYGHGCACMKVDTNKRLMRITRVYWARPVPLRQCYADKALPKP